jgi:hypothetical protein
MAGLVMTRSQFPRELVDGLNLVWGLDYEQRKGDWEEIYSKHTSDRAYEEEVMVSGLGGAMIKNEGEAFRYDSTQEGWTARYRHDTVALGIQFSQEAIEDNRYLKLGTAMVKELANSFQFTKDVLGAAPINNGFNTSFPGGDGQPLFSLVHPLTGGGTLANKPAIDVDLAEESLEDAMVAIDGFVDERGKPCVAMANKLIIPRQYEFIATRILKNAERPGTSNRDINALVKMGKIPGGVAVNHFLSDFNQWTLLVNGQGITDNGLKYFERVKLQSDSDPEFNTGNIRFKKRERYSFGWTNWRGAYGSSGST